MRVVLSKKQRGRPFRYNMRDIARLAKAAFKAVGVKPKQVTSLFVFSQGSLATVWSLPGADTVTLRLPKNPEKFNLAYVARLLWWARAIAVGIKNSDMTAEQNHGSGPLPDWATPVRVVEPKKSVARKASMPLTVRRADRASKMLAASEHALKLAQRRVRKWRAKVRYYERVTAKWVGEKERVAKEATERAGRAIDRARAATHCDSPIV